MAAGQTTTALLLLAFLAGCGGGSEAPAAPRSEPDDASSAARGDHVIHFSALATDQIPPAIAREYNIIRSKGRAMLNISVIDAESGLPVSARVGVKTRNLTGQLKNVAMREIREPGETIGIYYIGETPIADRETLVFEVAVTPEGKTEAYDSITFKRQFYTR